VHSTSKKKQTIPKLDHLSVNAEPKYRIGEWDEKGTDNTARNIGLGAGGMGGWDKGLVMDRRSEREGLNRKKPPTSEGDEKKNLSLGIEKDKTKLERKGKTTAVQKRKIIHSDGRRWNMGMKKLRRRRESH